MNLKESIVFGILLLSALELAEPLPGNCKCQCQCNCNCNVNVKPGQCCDCTKVPPPIPSGVKREPGDFGYGECDGPYTWPDNFPTCGGFMQSPININLATAINLNCDSNLIMENYYEVPNKMTLRNSGKTVAIEAEFDNGKRPFIQGGTLTGKYIFQEIHFHWGATAYEPSDHLFNGHSFPLEMHVIHYKEDYGSFQNALAYEDGLSVIGYVFEPSVENNNLIQQITNEIPKVKSPSDPPILLTPFAIGQLAPTFTEDFVTYKGSLTVPPCNEIVNWIVYLRPLTVNCCQVKGFREIVDSKGIQLIRNFRPIQKLNGRKVFLVSKNNYFT